MVPFFQTIDLIQFDKLPAGKLFLFLGHFACWLVSFLYLCNGLLMFIFVGFVGQNATVAVMSYSGYDIEVKTVQWIPQVVYISFSIKLPQMITLRFFFLFQDALILNKASVDRGTINHWCYTEIKTRFLE